MLLKKEQLLLVKVRDGKCRPATSSTSKLQALGTARNELIQWIENELSRAGESSEETDMDVQRLAPGHQGRNYIESELVSIHRQYARYSKARQELVIVAVGQLDSQATTNPDEHDALSLETLESDGSLNSTHLTYPYLEQMVSVLNEQKALIQQKSHITISLSKQLKEAGQGLDRQADESHLLPAYPMRAKVGPWKGPESSNSFADEISNYEKPDSSQRAQAWVHSSASAANATKESILEKLEEGSMAIDDTRQILIELQRLLGVDNLVSLEDVENTSKSQDIWAGIDGNLSVIKNDKGDAV
ncbi:hypothetical protein G7Y89_g11047 [Cudoniella acicularis]|uniref:Uncharacterized protein n=1 Tax=Cudoniella acicularis TaxID=354080 RepID=A0A8H4RDV6_9HELO|nr:hypothetical protein G7Y89_g11047 [Cudoniella acicularis]